MWVPHYETTLLTVKDPAIAIAMHRPRLAAPAKPGFYLVHTDSVVSLQQLKRRRAARTPTTSSAEFEHQGSLRPAGS